MEALYDYINNYFLNIKLNLNIKYFKTDIIILYFQNAAFERYLLYIL